MNALTLCHELACLALLYTVFCRFVHTTHETVAAIRFAFLALGTLASIGLCVPLVWPGEVTWFGVLLLTAIAFVQTITARYWFKGTPPQFRR